MVALGGASAASAETLAGALIKAYQASPQLDANEAALRSLDECVPQETLYGGSTIGRASSRRG